MRVTLLGLLLGLRIVLGLLLRLLLVLRIVLLRRLLLILRVILRLLVGGRLLLIRRIRVGRRVLIGLLTLLILLIGGAGSRAIVGSANVIGVVLRIANLEIVVDLGDAGNFGSDGLGELAVGVAGDGSAEGDLALMVAAVMRSFLRASEASSAWTTSISTWPSVREAEAGAAS